MFLLRIEAPGRVRPCRPVRLARASASNDGPHRTRARAGTTDGDRRRRRGPGSATAPYRSTPTAADCTTPPGRRTWWPRPASKGSPPRETPPRPRSATGWSGSMRSPSVSRSELARRSAWPGTLTAPGPAPAARTPVVTQSVRRRTRPVVHQHPAPVERWQGPEHRG